MSVVVGQPAMGGKAPEMPMMAMPNQNIVVVPQGLPAGLAYLGQLNEVLIHQHFDTLEGIKFLNFSFVYLLEWSFLSCCCNSVGFFHIRTQMIVFCVFMPPVI